MAKAKNSIYTDFSAKDSLYLDIDGTQYKVSQFSASWAVNEIPTAQCLIATGRDARSKNAATPATVHIKSQYRVITKAKVYFEPAGEYAADGTKWPNGPQVIFEGYFLGFASRKMAGKISVVANLSHWLLDMACSSCLTAGLAPTNHTQLTAAAVMAFNNATGAAKEGANIGSLLLSQLIQSRVAKDTWGAIKTIYCFLAGIKTNPAGPTGQCGGQGDFRANDRALRALSRIEGDAEDCPFVSQDGNKTYAVPLSITTAPAQVIKQVTDGLASEVIDAYSNTTFWDKLISTFCPALGLAVVPMIGRSLVIADTPAYRGGIWRDIPASEHEGVESPQMLDQPIRGVAVVAEGQVQTMAFVNEKGNQFPVFGGCYIEESVEPGDGIIQVVPPPSWLRLDPGANALDIINPNGKAGKINGSDAKGKAAKELKDPTPETFGASLNEYYQKYAHTVYATNMLRGRNGMMSGKLRFDIAPGSIIRIQQKAEQFIGAEDSLAANLVACVNRVTVIINAETPAAATTFQLSHIRVESPENEENRTSVEEHPLFGKSIHGGGKHGAPLHPAYEFEVR